MKEEREAEGVKNEEGEEERFAIELHSHLYQFEYCERVGQKQGIR